MTLTRLKDRILADGLNVLRVAQLADGNIEEEIIHPAALRQNCYSISKNFTAAAVGILADSGLLSVDDTLDRFFDLSAYDGAYKAVKVKHLLRQTMGIGKGFLFEADRYKTGSDDWIDYTFRQPLVHAPGEKMVYSNSTYYLLSCIVEKVSGLPCGRFLERNLFRKIGITDWAWDICPRGHTMGATGLYLATKDLVRFGQLYLQNGMFGEERVLSGKWVHEAHTFAPGEENNGYAYGFWLIDDLDYACRGANGQEIVISNRHHAVIAAHAYEQKGNVEKVLVEHIGAR